MVGKAKILFNIPKDIKDEFSDTCGKLGMNMTNVLIGMILEFNRKAQEKPNK